MTGDRPHALSGPRTVLERGGRGWPSAFEGMPDPPQRLYVVGSVEALGCPSIAVVGARKATPYGIGCARRFSGIAAAHGVSVVSGGARGCDGAAHRAAIEAGGTTVVFLGGGCDELYPVEHRGLFQRVVDADGAVVSERPWDFKPLPYTFRLRNRLIAGLAQATLIVEAGLPSGTFSTADEALASGREVLAVPGAITSATSRGANRLIAQGATPIVDDEAFLDALLSLYGCLRAPEDVPSEGPSAQPDPLVAAILAEPMGMEQLHALACEQGGEEDAWTRLMVRLAAAERDGLIGRYPDGRYGPAVRYNRTP